MGSIYIIKNLTNNKVYIGQTIQKWERRVKCHFWEALRGDEDTKLNRAIVKYGKENFSYKLVTKCDELQLDNLEILYIKVFNSFKNGYNSTEGGQGSSGKKVSEETKEKIRNFQKQYNSDPKIKEKKRQDMSGSNHHQYNKMGVNNKNYGIVRQKTLDNIPIIIEVRNRHAKGEKAKDLGEEFKKSHKTIKNWCGPDFEKYGGPTTTNCSIKRQSENRRNKLVLNRAVQRLDGSGPEKN